MEELTDEELKQLREDPIQADAANEELAIRWVMNLPLGTHVISKKLYDILRKNDNKLWVKKGVNISYFKGVVKSFNTRGYETKSVPEFSIKKWEYKIDTNELNHY